MSKRQTENARIDEARRTQQRAAAEAAIAWKGSKHAGRRLIFGTTGRSI